MIDIFLIAGAVYLATVYVLVPILGCTLTNDQIVRFRAFDELPARFILPGLLIVASKITMAVSGIWALIDFIRL